MYLATIKFGHSSHSQTFNNVNAAKEWLDSQNNNNDCKTVIDHYDEDWNLLDSMTYTEGNPQ